MSERLKIVRSPVRSRPQPQQKESTNLKEKNSVKTLPKALEEHKQIFRWALVGTTTFLIDYIFFISLYLLTSSVLFANFISAIFAIIFNYLAHYQWSFRSQLSHSESSLKYFISLSFFWVVNTTLLKILITAGLEARYAKLIPVLIISPFSFVILNFLVFRKRSKKIS
jgi:putative flippase GtrA